MMKTKKLLSITLAAGLLITAMTGTAIAAAEDNAAAANAPYYLSVTGTVVSMGEAIGIEDENGAPANLIVSDKTVYPFESEFSVGDVVTGYYPADAPMLKIWPPQYNIAVLVAGAPEGGNIKVDRFYTWEENADGYMLAQSGSFAFKVNEETEVVLADGKDFTGGDIEGRRLVVIYSVSTRSIPELTTASKVIVLFEDAVPLPAPAPEAVMIPLRANAEALGFKVEWVAAERAVILNGTVKLVIGENGSVIVNNVTYVPLEFFRDTLKTPDGFTFIDKI